MSVLLIPRGTTWPSSLTELGYGYTGPSVAITATTLVCQACHDTRIADDVVSLDGSEPVIQTGMIPDPGTYQSVLYQATKLDLNAPHYIQVTNLPGQSRDITFRHC